MHNAVSMAEETVEGMTAIGKVSGNDKGRERAGSLGGLGGG